MQPLRCGTIRAIAIVLVTLLGGMLAHAQSEPSPFPVLDARMPIPYFIAEGAPRSGYTPRDRTLAYWALKAWERAAGGVLHFQAAPEPFALVRLYWVALGSQYGEARPLIVAGKPGAAVYVRPRVVDRGDAIAQLARRDPLFRDTVVYLTCLHELGHALGLSHTAHFADIMYYFGYGGDVVNYFLRYRSMLRTQEDIQQHSGLSANDMRRIRTLYPRNQLDPRGRR